MESWWFSEDVQTKVAAKQSRLKELFACREGTQEDIDMEKERTAKARERRRRDLRNVRYIKDERGRTIFMEEDIRKRWREYFSSLFNESRPEGSGKV
nr:hypothetical protein [Tanacetum cinerariifolium]